MKQIGEVLPAGLGLGLLWSNGNSRLDGCAVKQQVPISKTWIWWLLCWII